jgi:hypothetical protein
MGKRVFSLTFLISTLITALACVLAVNDHHQEVNSLNFLAPAITFLSSVGLPLSSQSHLYFSIACAALSALLLLIMITMPFSSRWLVMLGLICALTGQLLLLDTHFWQFQFLPELLRNRVDLALPVGISLYGLAAALLLIALYKQRADTVYDEGRALSGAFTTTDATIFLLCFLAAVLLRVYAINYVVNSFDGELSPYSAGATSLTGMWYANAGYHGPWAPLGILYYLPIYLTTSLFGTDLVSLRLSSAIVGLLTIPCVYLLAARLGGKSAGQLAAALFTLNTLHIGWSRTDIHPHGVTTWPTLLMCYSLLKLYDTRKMTWAIAVALLMGLSWHQYPSGQSAVIIPLAAIGIFWLCNRLTLPVSLSHVAILCCGLLLWFAGLPFTRYMVSGKFFFSNPFNLTGPRALWGAGEAPQSALQLALFTAREALIHLGDVIQGLFFKVPYLFHQEWVAYSWDTTARTAAWVEMPLVVLGGLLLVVAVKRFESAVLLAWLCAAVLPGILAEKAYPKRLSTLYPALDIIAAIGFVILLHTVTYGARSWRRYPLRFAAIIALICGFCFQSNIWFSGRFWRYGEPFEVQLAKDSATLFTPNTLAITFVGGGYDVGKFTYLWLDRLADPKNRPNMLYFAAAHEMETLAQNPVRAANRLTANWPYLWTKLRDQLQETRDNKEWRQVVFFIARFHNEKFPTESLVQQAMEICHNPQKHEFIADPKKVSGNPLDIVAISCLATDLKQPLSL